MSVVSSLNQRTSFNMIKPPIHSESEVTLSTVSKMPKSCGFLAVPRELRDIVYTHLITVGDLAILRVYQQVHDEAKDLLYTRGIFRLRLLYVTGFTYIRVMDPLRILPNRVQNFNIKIDVRTSMEYNDNCRDRFERLDLRYQNLIQGVGTCHITFGYQSSIFVATPAVELIESLTTFKLLTLRIHLRYAWHPRDRRNDSTVEPDHTRMLQSIEASLSAALGVPDWEAEPCPSLHCQVYAHPKADPQVNPFPGAKYLVFHPHKARETPGNVSQLVLRHPRGS